ncbi:hypothetical protein [Nocardia sp. BMG111209]|uniref:hypothetical protein n=1 Tax=Nocardia sp. BMG111209 TaxID=1160137 RepID=UPI0003756986|nr:hypothetical protein [Nocardia sp. BMG111209]
MSFDGLYIGNEQLLIPGFSGFEEMRTMNEFSSLRLYANYDDADLHQVSAITFASAEPAQQGIGFPVWNLLGLVHAYGGVWYELYYTIGTVPASGNSDKTMVFVGQPGTMQFYVPGLVAIDGIHQTNDQGEVEVYVRANGDNAAEVHQVTIGGSRPNREIPAGATDLGIIHPWGNWQYVYATDTIVPAA